MIFVVVMLVIGVCSAVFADAGTADGDSCGLTHVWAQAKPAPQPESPLLEGLAARPDTSYWRTQIGTSRLVGWERDDLRVPSPVVRPSAPRAPPLV